jgi:autotransporter passenger strand-loop-strand repeat protein
MTVYSGAFSGTLVIGGDVYGDATQVDSGTLSLDISIDAFGDVDGSGTMTDTSVYTVPEPPEYGNFVSEASGSDTEGVGGSIDTEPPGFQVLAPYFAFDGVQASDGVQGSFAGDFNSTMTEITGTIEFSDDNTVAVTLYGQPALPPVISFDSGSLQVDASEGTATYTLTRGPVPIGDTGSSVLVSTEDGTAVAGTDYDALDQFLVVFGPGDTTATFTVGITPNAADAKAGINPDFSVVLSDPTNASIGFGTADTTILETDDTTSTTTLSGGETGDGIVVSGGGTLDVVSGGTATGTIVPSGGSEIVGAGGTASGSIVSSGGFAIVSAGGVASGTVLSGGFLVVSSGGSVAGVSAGSGGGTVALVGGGSVVAGTSGLTIAAGRGADTVNALAGGDTVAGNASGTAIVFGATGDVIENGSGVVYFTLEGGTNPTIFSLSGGSALLYAGADDTLVGGGGTAVAIGAAGDDFVLG